MKSKAAKYENFSIFLKIKAAILKNCAAIGQNERRIQKEQPQNRWTFSVIISTLKKVQESCDFGRNGLIFQVNYKGLWIIIIINIDIFEYGLRFNLWINMINIKINTNKTSLLPIPP